jgi:hypothetical protein
LDFALACLFGAHSFFFFLLVDNPTVRLGL